MKTIILGLKQDHPNAAHVVYAFILGDVNSEELGMSDDGEPKGTSGRPTLEVLKGSGLRFVLVTTVRYFGGTKLGTGGLVRAYGQAAKLAVENTSFELVRDLLHCSVELPYQIYEKLHRFLQDFYTEKVSENFGEQVQMYFSIEKSDENAIRTFVKDISRGSCTLTVRE